MTNMRAKMIVDHVTKHDKDSETLHFKAVCKKEGYDENGLDENNTFAKFTPSADLSITINNPDLVGKFKLDEEYYLDFTLADG